MIWQQLRTRSAGQSKRIVLADGSDERAVGAAIDAVRERVAEPILVGARSTVNALWTHLGGTGMAPVKDPALMNDEEAKRLLGQLVSLPKFKSLDEAQAREKLLDPLVYGTLLLKSGLADGFIGGATRTTSDTLRAVFSVIGLAPNTSVLFGFFLMSRRDDASAEPVLLADCAVIPEPSRKQLVQVGVAGAHAYRQLTGYAPRVAYLSFSTHGSAVHPNVEAMRLAADDARQSLPGIPVEGEWQADAALDPFSARIKGVGDSPVAGRANVLIVPDLNTGNIAYKLAQRLGGVRAVGPVLWGTARPANDLSRGCSREDIFDLVAITAIQSQLQEGVSA